MLVLLLLVIWSVAFIVLVVPDSPRRLLEIIQLEKPVVQNIKKWVPIKMIWLLMNCAEI